MRILELEIHEIRGIRDLTIRPDGANIVIWGPNGAGKSAVVDAIDFLLTGSMSRLRGRGTGGISLSEHGPHVDSDLDAAYVRAVVSFPTVQEPVELSRRIAAPSQIECEEAVRPRVEEMLNLARRGQHVLTRREILRFITAEAGTRAQEIQALLNLTPIENVRRALVTVRNDFRELMETARSSLALADGRLKTLTGAATSDEQALLNFVNDRRATLGGEPLDDLASQDLKSDAHPPSVSSSVEEVVNKPIIVNAVASIRGALAEDARRSASDLDEALRAVLEELRSDPSLREETAREDLSRLGLSLLGDQEVCPLCGTAWPEGELRTALTARLERAARSTSLNRIDGVCRWASRQGLRAGRERAGHSWAAGCTRAGFARGGF